jgi:uncharacterized protein (TIGR03067 family)
VFALLALAVAAAPPPAHPLDRPIPFRPLNRGLIALEGTADGRPVRLLLDTGATGLVFTKAAVARLRLPPDGRIGTTSTTFDGRTAAGVYHQVVELRFGWFTDRRFSAQAVDLPLLDTLSAQVGVTLDGVLGADLLNRTKVVIDYAAGVVRFAPGWLPDLAAMQGRWRATDVAFDGRPVRPATRQKLPAVTLRVRGDRLTLDMTPIGSVHLDHWLALQPDRSPKRWASGDIRINRQPPAPGDVGQVGLYELSPGRLRMLLPYKYVTPDQLPATLSPPPNSGLTLMTFERPARPPGWLHLLLAAVVPGMEGPVRLGGWDVSFDGRAVTAVRPGRRVAATWDGSFGWATHP